jgi:hypothetical protein
MSAPRIIVALAAAPELPVEPPSNAVMQAFRESWLIIAAALALGLVLIACARFAQRGSAAAEQKRRRVEGARHGQRPTNPTLAETGGLPPVRPVGTPPSDAPPST